MNYNHIFILISSILFVILPEKLSLYMDLLLISSYSWWSYNYAKKHFMGSLIIVIFYLLMNVIYYIIDYKNILPITGILIYIILSFEYIFNIFMIICRKKYFTNRIKFFCFNLIYFVFHIIIVVLSLMLRPDFSYIYMPFILLIISNIVKDNVMNFLSTFRIDDNEFLLGKYRIKEVNNKDDFVKYNNVLKNIYMEIFREIKFKNNQESLQKDNFNEVLEEKIDLENDRKVLLLLEYDNEVIGCLKVTICQPLPIEKDMNLDLTYISKEYGNMGEISRFSIYENHRSSANLMEGIFIYTAIICRRYDITFLFCQAIEKTKLLYHKMGFQFLSISKSSLTITDNEFGMVCTPMYINMVNKIKETGYEDFSKSCQEAIIKTNIDKYLINYVNYADEKLYIEKTLPISQVKTFPKDLIRKILDKHINCQ